MMVNYPPEYYLLRFGTNKDNVVNSLYWATENTDPKEEAFRKERVVDD